MMRPPPRSTRVRSSAASDVYKRQIRAVHVDRARHAADAARRRYLAVDPTNRLVADALEADWNDKLRGLAESEEDYRRVQGDNGALTAEQQTRIRALSTDFPVSYTHLRAHETVLD